jgi:uncharacterized membrane protein YhhN
MKKVSLILFFTAGIVEVFSGMLSSEMLHFVGKPLIMIALGVYYFLSEINKRSIFVVRAIFFSLLGDVVLMLESRDGIFFVLGLASFLIAHIFYIVAYGQHQEEVVVDELHGIQKTRLAFPIVLAGSGLIIVLYSSLGDLKIPVVIYALVLIVMVLNALFRYGRTNANSFWLVFIGSLLFMISDSILAINKFLQPISLAKAFIMVTYTFAQFFIVRGLIMHHKKKQAPINK